MLQRIGRYEILERIAAGDQGTVYRARDTVLDWVVAVKVINQPVTDDSHDSGNCLVQKVVGGVSSTMVVVGTGVI